MELPKLTQKEQTCLLRYFSNCRNQSEAYRYAYDSDAKASTVAKEASKLFRSSKFLAWIEYYEKNQAETIKTELNYTAKQAFDEFVLAQEIAMERNFKTGTVNVGAFIKAVEFKSRLAGHLKDITKIESDEGMTLFYSKASEKAKKLEDELLGG